MKEKIKAFLQSEKLRGILKKVFNKKTIIAALIIIVIAIAARVTFSMLFEIEGVVNKVDGSKVTVVNFLRTQTVDIGNLKTTSTNIQVGDRIEIRKNISGDIMSVRDFSQGNFKRNFRGDGYSYNRGGNNLKGNGERNGMRKR